MYRLIQVYVCVHVQLWTSIGIPIYGLFICEPFSEFNIHEVRSKCIQATARTAAIVYQGMKCKLAVCIQSILEARIYTLLHTYIDEVSTRLPGICHLYIVRQMAILCTEKLVYFEIL